MVEVVAVGKNFLLIEPIEVDEKLGVCNFLHISTDTLSLTVVVYFFE